MTAPNLRFDAVEVLFAQCARVALDRASRSRLRGRFGECRQLYDVRLDSRFGAVGRVKNLG